MMTPEMMKLAQEQFARMSPEQMQALSRQMASMDPSTMQAQMAQAQAMMGNMSQDQMKAQMDHMSRMSPEELERCNKQATDNLKAQVEYRFNGAQMLKEEGNNLHRNSRFEEAAAKYQAARSNLVGNTSPAAMSLDQSCSLNLASCYLKLGKHEEVVSETSSVLQADPDSLKALYRRGLSYKALGQLEFAEEDLRHANSLFPDDANVATALEDVRKQLPAQRSSPIPNGDSGGKGLAALAAAMKKPKAAAAAAPPPEPASAAAVSPRANGAAAKASGGVADSGGGGGKAGKGAGGKAGRGKEGAGNGGEPGGKEAGKQGTEEEAGRRREELRAQSIRQLREQCTARGLDYGSCVDKSDLIDLLLAPPPAAAAAAPAAAAPAAGEGA